MNSSAPYFSRKQTCGTTTVYERRDFHLFPEKYLSLVQYVPHDHHTEEKTFQTSDKPSNGRVQHVRMLWEDISLRIASFSSVRLDGPVRYTRDFKYPQTESLSVLNLRPRSHGYLQQLGRFCLP
ncbi:hypothetical protein TNCV_263261 [Trichonephila clavipes]|nr:hypothetical protein TNCV_263261 [Trichonephila clavipes]